MKSPKFHARSVTLMAVAIGMALSGSAFAANFNYTNSFDRQQSDGSYVLTTTPSAGGADYFYRAGSDVSWENFQQGATDEWGGGPVIGNMLRGRWKSLSQPPVPELLFRNLHDGNTLAAGAYLTDATASIDSKWLFGGDSDFNLVTYIGLLNSSGNGYVAGVGRNGVASIYQLSQGFSEARIWTVVATADLSFNTNLQTITFSLVNGELRVGSSANSVASLSVTNQHLIDNQGIVYTDFTTLVIGARMVAEESVYLDNVVLTGTAVPEPSTAALFAGVAVLAVTFARGNRRHHD